MEVMVPRSWRRVVDEIARALASFADIGLRHRDLRPCTILVRSLEPLDLVITGFGSARLSDFDLDVVSPLELTRYAAPETIVGGISAASDWWSLGMILLERVTHNQCFADVNEKAFMIHVVTRGVSVPSDVDPSLSQLLRGLLTRDPVKRWQWPQVRRWLAGEEVDVASETVVEDHGDTGPAIELAGRGYSRPANFALAAAEPENWEAAKNMFLRGVVGTWLEEAGADNTTIAEVRRAQGFDLVAEDHRHALAIMAMNPTLPFIVRGEIVSPAWLLSNPDEGHEIVTGQVTVQLRHVERELWLYQLRERAERVRDKARTLEIELDEETFPALSRWLRPAPILRPNGLPGAACSRTQIMPALLRSSSAAVWQTKTSSCF